MGDEDVKIFDGTGYDRNESIDHFFRDEFRSACTLPVPTSEPLTYFTFRREFLMQPSLEQVVGFFNCFGKITTPLRWDRIAGLQLLLAAFVDVVGYDDVHARSQDEFNAIGDGMVSPTIRRNFESWFPGLKLLDESGAAKIAMALNPALRLSSKVPSVMGA